MEETERLIKLEEDFFPSTYGSNKATDGDVRTIHRRFLYEPPEDYFWLSVAACVCCFCLPPFGLLAVYRSRQVPRLYMAGDEHGAYRASGQAKGFALLAFMFGTMLVMALTLSLAYCLHLGL